MCEVLKVIYDAEERRTHSFVKYLLNGRVPVMCLCVLRECRDEEGSGFCPQKGHSVADTLN